MRFSGLTIKYMIERPLLSLSYSIITRYSAPLLYLQISATSTLNTTSTSVFVFCFTLLITYFCYVRIYSLLCMCIDIIKYFKLNFVRGDVLQSISWLQLCACVRRQKEGVSVLIFLNFKFTRSTTRFNQNKSRDTKKKKHKSRKFIRILLLRVYKNSIEP